MNQEINKVNKNTQDFTWFPQNRGTSTGPKSDSTITKRITYEYKQDTKVSQTTPLGVSKQRGNKRKDFPKMKYNRSLDGTQ